MTIEVGTCLDVGVEILEDFATGEVSFFFVPTDTRASGVYT